MDVHKIDVDRMQGLSPAPRSKKEALSMDLEAWRKECKRQARRADIAYTILLALAFLGCVAIAYFITCLWLAFFGVL